MEKCKKRAKNMTPEQALQIRELRKRGMGYRAISLEMDISRDRIRNYCKNHGIGGYRIEYDMNLKDRMEEGKACIFCGAELKHKKTGRHKKFCCETCRRAYWKNNRGKQTKGSKAIYTVECAYCRKIFESYGNKHRKYCCHEHYILDRFGEKRIVTKEEDL